MSREFYDCIGEWADRCHKAEAELATLKEENKRLKEWYDKTFGLPAEEIRHARQVEALEAELATVKRQLGEVEALKEVVHLDQYQAVQEELAKVTKERERLRGALEIIQQIRFLLGNDPRLNPAYEMGDIADKALKEMQP